MCGKMASNYTMKTFGVFYESHNATMQGYVKQGDTPIRVKLKPEATMQCYVTWIIWQNWNP
jgi:hypothetical protein